MESDFLTEDLAEGPSLGLLAQKPIEERFQFLLNTGRVDLETAVSEIRSLDSNAFVQVDAERIAWAIAYNILPPGQSIAANQKTWGYADRYEIETPWARIWSKLRGDSKNRGSLLVELGLSVACEQRQDWLRPSAPPIDTELSKRSCGFIYVRDSQKVVGTVRSSFGERAGDPEQIAAEAWARVLRDYWSIKARRRFLGLSKISTFVSDIAQHVALDELRAQDRYVHETAEDSDNEQEKVEDLIEKLGVDSGIIDLIQAEQLGSQIDKCFQALAARRQVVARLVWFGEKTSRHAAQYLGITDAAVSQHLRNAREDMRNCLEANGFRVSGVRGQSRAVQ